MSRLARARETALGHLATVSGYARGALRPHPVPASERVELAIEDPSIGALTLVGELSNPEAETLVVIVHGLGGNVTSAYALRAAQAAVDAGFAALRIHMRGAIGDGADLYHAGLGGDLAQVTRAPALARYRSIAILGYSMGGHISLRHAADGPHDPRLACVLAVCPPVDLDRGTLAIQRVDRRPYQEFILRFLRQQLLEVRAKHPERVSDIDTHFIRTIRDWDQHVICPRFGFPHLSAYYDGESVGPRLASVTVPTLVVVADRDPMIALDTVEPWIARVSERVTVVRKRRGGHVAFPPDVGLLQDRGAPMERELMAWISAEVVRVRGPDTIVSAASGGTPAAITAR